MSKAVLDRSAHLRATAERHRVTVLHYDEDFDRIAEVTGQPAEWAVPPGEAD